MDETQRTTDDDIIGSPVMSPRLGATSGIVSTLDVWFPEPENEPTDHRPLPPDTSGVLSPGDSGEKTEEREELLPGETEEGGREGGGEQTPSLLAC